LQVESLSSPLQLSSDFPTDLVPLRDVAVWRSYANIAATTGRSLGGPIGGYLTDEIGWRWLVLFLCYGFSANVENYRSFLGQCPPTILALALVAWKLKIPSLATASTQSALSKLRRVDFLGAIFLSVSIVCGLLVLDLGGQRMPWTDPKILLLLGSSVMALNIFVLIEAVWAKEPIFPLRLLLNRDVITSYVNLAFQTGAQGAVSTNALCFSRVLIILPDDAARPNVFPSLSTRFAHQRGCTSDAICDWERIRRSFGGLCR
jgi:MFS family permease